jgi:hypothetical protein
VAYANFGGVRPDVESAAGYRVISYSKRMQDVIWMLTIYPKNVAENIPAHVLRQIRKEVENG